LIPQIIGRSSRGTDFEHKPFAIGVEEQDFSSPLFTNGGLDELWRKPDFGHTGLLLVDQLYCLFGLIVA